MNKNILLCLLIVASVAAFQSCQLERMDPPCPEVVSISPIAAHAGETVTITGSKFLPGLSHLYKVKIGDKVIDSSLVTIPNSTTMSFKVPIGTITGPLTVSLASKTDCTSDPKTFTYYYTGTKVEVFAGTPKINSCSNCLNLPMGIDLDLTENNESLIIADYFNLAVRRIPLSGSTINTFGKLGITPMCNQYPVSSSSTTYFNKPTDVAINSSGDIFVSEDIASLISVLRNKGQGKVDLIAGICPRDSRFKDGLCSIARLSAPYNLSIDGNNLYFADGGQIRVVELVPGIGCSSSSTINIRTILANTATQNFKALEVSHSRVGQGPIFIADIKEGNIKSLSLDGKPTTLTPNFSSGNQPMALTLDKQGNIFIAANHRIYVLYTNGMLSTLAGTGDANFSNGNDGNTLSAQFNTPSGLALYEGHEKILFVSDTYNHVIRKVLLQ